MATIKINPYDPKKAKIGVPSGLVTPGIKPITQNKPVQQTDMTPVRNMPIINPGVVDKFKPATKPVIGQPVSPTGGGSGMYYDINDKKNPITADQYNKLSPAQQAGWSTTPVSGARHTTPNSTGGTQQKSHKAIDEAKAKTEASKEAALAGYEPLDTQLAGMGDLITPEQQQQLINQRKDQLANAGQNLTEALGDSNSGIQQGRRIGIASSVANSAANLPIETQLDVAQANRAANLNVIGQRSNIANARSAIQQGYQYDPGLEYIAALGGGFGELGGFNNDSSSSVSSLTSSGTNNVGKNSNQINNLQDQINILENEYNSLKGSGSIYDLSSFNRKTEITNLLQQLRSKLRILTGGL
jgi:hypothetical protein